MNVGAAKKIRPDQLTKTLAESLLEWEQENEEKFFRAIDDAADACNETAGQYLTPGHGYKTGEYKRHFAIERQLTIKVRNPVFYGFHEKKLNKLMSVNLIADRKESEFFMQQMEQFQIKQRRMIER